MVQHSKEFALDQHEFEQFVDGCRRIDDRVERQEALYIAFVGGRLGLRAGELLHLDRDWIDWRNRMIDVPEHDQCTGGEDGGVCGYCCQQARAEAERSELSLSEARLEVIQNNLLGRLSGIPGHVRRQLSTTHIVSIDADLGAKAINKQIEGILAACDGVDDTRAFRSALDEMAAEYQDEHRKGVDDVLEQKWGPKTENSVRSVPFDWCPRAEMELERFLDLHGGWPLSMTAIRRRVNKALRLAHGLDESTTKPHGLRATAASELAARNVSATTLMQMFGWAQISTAQAYIEASPERSRKQLYR